MRLWYHKQVLNFLPYKMCLEVVVEEGFGFSVNQGTGTSFSWHFQWVHWHWNLVWSCSPVKCGRGFKSPLPNNSIFIIPTLSLLLEEILATTLCKSICLPWKYIAYIYANVHIQVVINSVSFCSALPLMLIIILSKYFLNSDWLKAHT